MCAYVGNKDRSTKGQKKKICAYVLLSENKDKSTKGQKYSFVLLSENIF